MLYLFKEFFIKLGVVKLRLGFEQALFFRNLTWKVGSFFYALGFVGAIMSWQTVSAQTFDISSTIELNLICNAGDPNTPGTPDSTTGAELTAICSQLTGPPGTGGVGGSAGVGTQSQPNALLISQQQLKDAKTSKEKDDMVPGSADVMTTHWSDKFSTFLSSGATTLHHSSNKYEQGYTATIPSVTVGGGYLFSDKLETGMVFNYTNSNGDYSKGGGFNVDSFSPLMYINYLPFDNAFTNLVLGYTRQNITNNRIAVATSSIPTVSPINRKTNGEFNTNQYNLNFLSGYDFFIDNFSIGPRVGVNVNQWDMDAYHENSKTGLELRYNSQHQTSIQTTLGLSASSAHSFTFGVLVPQVTASWVHEFDNDSRTIKSQFVQAPTSAGFSFQTERPERDWAVIDVGVSLVMQNGIQAFANFSTVQGNQNFESYGGNLGIRVGW